MSPACPTEKREECCSARSSPSPESSRWRKARDIAIDGSGDLRKLTSGPGRLAEAFGITRERDNEKDLTSPKSDLIIADDGFRPRRIESDAAHRHHQSRRAPSALFHRRQQIRFKINHVGPDAPSGRASAARLVCLLRHENRRALPGRAGGAPAPTWSVVPARYYRSGGRCLRTLPPPPARRARDHRPDRASQDPRSRSSQVEPKAPARKSCFPASISACTLRSP